MDFTGFADSIYEVKKRFSKRQKYQSSRGQNAKELKSARDASL